MGSFHLNRFSYTKKFFPHSAPDCVLLKLSCCFHNNFPELFIIILKFLPLFCLFNFFPTWSDDKIFFALQNPSSSLEYLGIILYLRHIMSQLTPFGSVTESPFEYYVLFFHN